MEEKKQTVLIVDDEPMNIEILNEALGAEQEIFFATSGQEALDIALNELPDLILLDVVLPDLDGYQVCAQLKADPKTRNIPVIFVTAMDHQEDEAKGLDMGAIDYLAKPIRSSIVKARVRNHLEIKRYRDYLENLSATDGLTGIPNRRWFDEQLEREWRRARRKHTPLSLILMDIDFFKAYNDHYGHLAGDDCLRQLAQALNQCVRRPADLVARYGGEEFVCLLPETNGEGTLCVANLFRKEVDRLNIPHACSSVADHVTLSIGVSAVVPAVGQPSFDLIRRADEHMYGAKKNGRNQIRSSF
jgi:diguanylate cyclase (GGDEF)-like protein